MESRITGVQLSPTTNNYILSVKIGDETLESIVPKTIKSEKLIAKLSMSLIGEEPVQTTEKTNQ